MSRLPRNSAGIGCKGGTSATAGKKSVIYGFTYPDGRAETYRTFKLAEPVADAHCYKAADGVWYLAGLTRVGAPRPFIPHGESVVVPAKIL